MSLFDNIKSFFILPENAPVENQLRASIKLKDKISKKKPLHVQVNKRTYRIESTLKKWRQAVMSAEDPQRPDRYILYIIYNQVMEDDQLLSQIRTARFNVQLGDFKIYRDDAEDEDTAQLLDKPWFFDYLQYCVDTELYGHTLVEFSMNKVGEIDEINIIPREHVKPETGQVVIEVSDEEGIPFREFLKELNLVEIGRKDDLGLLKSLSKLMIRKDYNLTDWGRTNERFGMPFIVARTASRDMEELDEKQNMLENFGANMWALLDDADQIDFQESLGSATGNGHRSFKDMNEYLDQCAAILVNGQTGTTDEKAHVGSAEVHERILNKYTLARMRRIQYHINEELFPFLVMKGLPFDNCNFQFTDLEQTEDKAVLDVSDASDVKQDDKKKD